MRELLYELKYTAESQISDLVAHLERRLCTPELLLLAVQLTTQRNLPALADLAQPFLQDTAQPGFSEALQALLKPAATEPVSAPKNDTQKKQAGRQNQSLPASQGIISKFTAMFKKDNAKPIHLESRKHWFDPKTGRHVFEGDQDEPEENVPPPPSRAQLSRLSQTNSSETHEPTTGIEQLTDTRTTRNSRKKGKGDRQTGSQPPAFLAQPQQSPHQTGAKQIIARLLDSVQNQLLKSMSSTNDELQSLHQVLDSYQSAQSSLPVIQLTEAIRLPSSERGLPLPPPLRLDLISKCHHQMNSLLDKSKASQLDSQQIVKLREQLKLLDLQLVATRDQLNGVTDEKDQLQARFKTQLQELQHQVDNLQAQNDIYLLRARHLQAQLSEQTQVADQLQADLEQAQSHIELLKAKLSENTHFTCEISSLQEQAMSYQQLVKPLQLRLQAQTHQIKLCRAQSRALELDREQGQAREQRLTTRGQQLQQDIAHQKQLCASLRQQNGALKAAVSEANRQLSLSLESRSLMEDEIERLRENAIRLGSELENSSRQKDELVNDMIGLTTRLGRQQESAQNIEDLERENEELEKELAMSTKVVFSLEVKLKQRVDRSKRLQKELSLEKRGVLQAESRLQQALQNCKNLEQQVSRQEQLCLDLERTASQLRMQSHTLSLRLEKEAKIRAVIESSLQQGEDRTRSTRQAKNVLERELIEVKGTLEVKALELEKVRRDSQRDRLQLQSLEKQNRRLNNNVSQQGARLLVQQEQLIILQRKPPALQLSRECSITVQPSPSNELYRLTKLLEERETEMELIKKELTAALSKHEHDVQGLQADLRQTNCIAQQQQQQAAEWQARVNQLRQQNHRYEQRLQTQQGIREGVSQKEYEQSCISYYPQYQYSITPSKGFIQSQAVATQTEQDTQAEHDTHSEEDTQAEQVTQTVEQATQSALLQAGEQQSQTYETVTPTEVLVLQNRLHQKEQVVSECLKRIALMESTQQAKEQILLESKQRITELQDEKRRLIRLSTKTGGSEGKERKSLLGGLANFFLTQQEAESLQ